MQLLFDFLPIIAFFVAYKLADIYVATGVLIAASVLQVTVYWTWKRRVNPMHIVSSGLVLLFGGLTLLVHDKAFIMWKPTVVNWLFAAAFLASLWPRVSDRPLIQRMFSASGAAVAAPELDVDRLLPADGRCQPGGFPQLRRSDLGELQALGNAGIDARVHPGAGLLACIEGRRP
jgi:hypothetical protein